MFDFDIKSIVYDPFWSLVIAGVLSGGILAILSFVFVSFWKNYKVFIKIFSVCLIIIIISVFLIINNFWLALLFTWVGLWSIWFFWVFGNFSQIFGMPKLLLLFFGILNLSLWVYFFSIGLWLVVFLFFLFNLFYLFFNYKKYKSEIDRMYDGNPE